MGSSWKQKTEHITHLFLFYFYYLKEAKNIDGEVRKTRPSSTGSYCFNGDGYVKIQPDNSMQVDRISIRFATIAPNGLLFFGVSRPRIINGIAEQEPTIFYALEMEKGYLVSKFDFGNGYERRVHDKNQLPVDDGKLHSFRNKAKLKDIAKNKKGFMRFGIDVEKVNKDNYQLMISFEEKNTYVINEVYLGGVPKRAELPHEYVLFFSCCKKTQYSS